MAKAVGSKVETTLLQIVTGEEMDGLRANVTATAEEAVGVRCHICAVVDELELMIDVGLHGNRNGRED